MKKISISLTDEQIQYVEELTEKQGEGRSEAVRTLVERGRNYAEVESEVETKVKEVEKKRREEVAELQREIDRLNRERRQLLEQREENKELVAFAENQRDLERRREDREDRRAAAGAFTRFKWWLVGDSDAKQRVRSD